MNRRHNNRQQHNTVPGIAVEVRNGDFNGAMRRFKKKVAESGVIQEYKQRQRYEKPSLKRARAKAAGRARWLKYLQKREREQGF